jgi:hypothetical protein
VRGRRLPFHPGSGTPEGHTNLRSGSSDKLVLMEKPRRSRLRTHPLRAGPWIRWRLRRPELETSMRPGPVAVGGGRFEGPAPGGGRRCTSVQARHSVRTVLTGLTAVDSQSSHRSTGGTVACGGKRHTSATSCGAIRRHRVFASTRTFAHQDTGEVLRVEGRTWHMIWWRPQALMDFDGGDPRAADEGTRACCL